MRLGALAPGLLVRAVRRLLRRRQSAGAASESARAEALLVVAEDSLRDLMLEVLDSPDLQVTVAPTAAEARASLSIRSYELVVVTNFGMAPWEAIRVVPATHAYPALFVSGHWDERLEHACAIRRLHRVKAPFDPWTLRDDVHRLIREGPMMN